MRKGYVCRWQLHAILSNWLHYTCALYFFFFNIFSLFLILSGRERESSSPSLMEYYMDDNKFAYSLSSVAPNSNEVNPLFKAKREQSIRQTISSHCEGSLAHNPSVTVLVFEWFWRAECQSRIHFNEANIYILYTQGGVTSLKKKERKCRRRAHWTSGFGNWSRCGGGV